MNLIINNQVEKRRKEDRKDLLSKLTKHLRKKYKTNQKKIEEEVNIVKI